MLTRIVLLFSLDVDHQAHRAALHASSGTRFSGRDLILIVGGLFLIAQEHLRDPRQAGRRGRTRLGRRWRASFGSVIVQIMLLDIVFSLDSVITAVGMVDELWVMITAVIVVGRR